MQAVQSRSSGPYNGNGVTTSFPYGFRIIDESEIEVTLYDSDGAPTVQSLTTHYTVSGVGDANGGSFTMVTPPAVGEQVRVKSVTTRKNEVDLSTNGDLLPEETEEQLDRLTMIAQDDAETLGRVLRAPAGDALDDMPGETTRANKVLSFDENGNPETTITGSSIASASTYATNAAASAAAAAASETAAGVSETNAAASAAAAVAALSGAGFRYAYSTTTADADPGAGTLRLNHATIASATALYIDEVDADGSDLTSWLTSWDDFGQADRRGFLSINGVDTADAFAVFRVTGSITDGTGYRKATLAHVASGGTFTDGEDFVVSFTAAGADGADGVVLLDKLDATAAPTTGDDDGDGYSVGSRWLDVTNGRAYVCFDASTGAADWREFAPPVATTAEAEAGTETEPRLWAPEQIAEAIAALTTSAPVAPDVIIEDQKASGTGGGAVNTGYYNTWKKRTLNTEVRDELGVTLSSDEVTLPAGTYYAEAESPGFGANGLRCRIYDETNTAEIALSRTAHSAANAQDWAAVCAVFTLASPANISVQYQSNYNGANSNNLGYAYSGAGISEVYTRLKIWRIA